MPQLKKIRMRLQTDSRLASVFKGGVSGLAGKGLTMLVSAVTLPLTLRYLGKLQYGIWVTISTTVVMLAVLDLGIANTLTNFISRAYAQNDAALARRSFATAFWITAGIALVLGLLGLFIFLRVDWGEVFRVSDPNLANAARKSVGIAVLFFLLSLPLNLANRVLSGYQEMHLGNYFLMLNSVLGLCAILGAVWLHGSLVTLMMLYCAANLLGSVVLNIWLCLWHRPEVRPHPGAVTFSMAGDLFGEGALFFVVQLAGLIVFNSDNLVITHYLGPSEVTPYSVAWRLCGYATMLQSMLVPSLWPAFSEAYHRHDMAWIRSIYRKMTRTTLVTVGVAALLLAMVGRPFIRLWAGTAAVPEQRLLWLMALWVVLLAATINQAMLLAATKRIQLQAVSSSLAAIFNLILSVILVRRIGSVGVLLATMISYIIFIYFPQMIEVRRVLTGRYLKDAVC